MGRHIAERIIKLLRRQDHAIKGARVGVLGLAFKENVPDLRNSRVPDIVEELAEYGIEALVHDPLASAEEARDEHGIVLKPFDALSDLDAVILAVPHRDYLDDLDTILARLRRGGIVVDVKSSIDAAHLRDDLLYWSL
jgi:UDP-N-acetyl-D-galactosamine dehydrogenase